MVKTKLYQIKNNDNNILLTYYWRIQKYFKIHVQVASETITFFNIIQSSIYLSSSLNDQCSSLYRHIQRTFVSIEMTHIAVLRSLYGINFPVFVIIDIVTQHMVNALFTSNVSNVSNYQGDKIVIVGKYLMVLSLCQPIIVKYKAYKAKSVEQNVYS